LKPLGEHGVHLRSGIDNPGEQVDPARIGWIGRDDGDSRPDLLVPASQLLDEADESQTSP
jgi:hypothetical protein